MRVFIYCAFEFVNDLRPPQVGMSLVGLTSVGMNYIGKNSKKLQSKK